MMTMNKRVRGKTGGYRVVRSPVRSMCCRRPALVFRLLMGLSIGLLVSCQNPLPMGSPSPRADEAGDAASSTDRIQLYLQTNWAIQSLSNLSNVDTASDTANTLLETQLRKQGVMDQVSDGDDAYYSVEGAVIRWQYAGGASARAEVAMTLNVRGRQAAELLWSGSASDKGRRGEAISAVADRLIARLLERMPLTDQRPPVSLPVGLVADGDDVLAVSGPGTGLSGLNGTNLQGLGEQEYSVASLMPVPGLRTSTAAPTVLDVTTDRPLTGRSTAFYYASKPPVDELSQFDRLVLEPDNILEEELHAMTDRGVVAYAYLSVGEVGPTRAYASELNPSWILGKNPAWDSDVLDLANPALREFLLARAGKLQADGYGGLFLDTMDSFNLIADTEDERERQQAGLSSLVREFAKRYPELRIMANRGFEVLDDIAPYIEAVVAESLYAAWNNTEQRYHAVPENDREWLLGKLDHARDNLQLDVIAIDYVPADQRDKARQVAARIAGHGFIPWVGNPALDLVGVGALEVVPRKVLMLYNSRLDGPIEETPVHKFVAMPIEYMGYVPEYLNMANEPLPTGELKGRYAGIVTWTNRRFTDPAAGPWLQKQLDDTVPVVFLGMPPVQLDERMSQSLGLDMPTELDVDSTRVVHTDEYIDPERSLSHRVDSVSHIAASHGVGNTVHMSLVDKNQRRADVVVTGDFGGFAWQPGLVDDALDYETYWVVDPFRFLRTALQLIDAPMPDVTTENGKRLWLAHIDGDALPSWAEMPGGQLGAEVIYDQILSQYEVPHTVSIVEAEMTEFPAYDDRRQRMFDIARKTFRLDHVQLASHTYSHPFKWAKLGIYRKSGKFNLAIDGYEYSPERDLAGSIDFVNRELAPDDKELEVMLWSGDALPQIPDLAVLDRLGIPNLNGGLTYITRTTPTMTLISPMARPVGPYLQVYAPVMNENMFTNDWLGPFDGFRNVIETFQMTESPRRLKPMNVYYHFYSGTKIAAMKALKEVYDWSLSQDIYPVHVSDYARKVPDFRRAGVARYLDGQWKLSGLGHVRSIRLFDQSRWPELGKETGLTGAKRSHDALYLHTDGADQVLFRLQNNEPQGVRLVSSNGRVLNWDSSGDSLTLRVSAEVPVTIELAGAVNSACSLRVGKSTVRGQLTADKTVSFSFSTRDTGHASLNCPA